jgi:hypothetical protein
MVADAHERLSQPDSAIVYLEMLLEPTYPAPPRLGFSVSFAHHRLARLYTEIGLDAKAREHREAFLDTFTHPDPEFEPMVEEAEGAVEALR